MPITEEGRKVLKNMIKQYGRKKGTSVFYASINAGKSGSSKWHGSSKSKGNKFTEHIKNMVPKGEKVLTGGGILG